MPQDMMTGSDNSSRFELTSFFAGRTRAWGIFEDRFGHLRRRLEVEMHGKWHGAVFVLDERFTYDSGEVENRRWLVEPTGDGTFRAKCPDCVGGAEGRCDQSSIRMSYRFRLKLQNREVDVSFDDRIYRISETAAINRATMSKWGVKLGELALFFERLPD